MSPPKLAARTIHGTPIHLLGDRGDEFVDVVIATLGAADLFGHVTDIGEAFSVEL
jgi:hypothetical protein